MIAWLGLGAILIALVAATTLAWRGLPALTSRASVTAERTRGPVLWLLGGAVAAMTMLEAGLLTDDFSIAYVANNHRSATPLIFTVASGWAALEGSIVLWGLVLAGFTASAFRVMHRRQHPLAGGTLSVLGMLAMFWFGLMATVANPFAVCTAAAEAGCSLSAWAPWSVVDAPVDGRGANPLLQNHILMAVHPPMLYVGYVGFSVPFAIGIASLAALRSGSTWLSIARRWTLTAWGFLTTGIVLGAWWSYEVLGWGGYWAWDPVENASFIPWLLATAFIHSAVVQARRGVLQSWNYILVIGTFAATVLGTFLTRSGVVASVHSFTQSSIGPVLLGFLAIVLVGSLTLFTARVHLVNSAPRLDSLASREGAFLLNNLLLAVFAFVVLSGTLFPLVVEAFQGATVGVGRPFFDRWAVPLSYCLLLAMGVGPVTPFRVARPRVLWERLRTPLRVSLAVAAVVVLVIGRNRHLIVVTLLATFVVAVIIRHLLTLVRSRRSTNGESMRRAAARLVRRDPGYWGGQISHVGVALLAVGISASANLAVSGSVELSPGEKTRFAGYELAYDGPFSRVEPSRTVVGARLEVLVDGRSVGFLDPRLNDYGSPSGPVVTPAVHSTPRGDLYVSLTRLDTEGLSADVRAYPLQWLVWLGGLVTASGAGFSLTAGHRRLATSEVTGNAKA
ncbi:MAG: cytochrome c biogenesis protein CcsA [bacterium]|nr:cytochrome c biogenesis protein CcsA [bacterium]MDE0290603.1 cytochrome c biogenesis protein CcsA [bacterium]MDE0439941.1 cytochrome c biogenesis protein CcsA [bacterium]